MGYGWVKCSGERSHALSVATAPVGSSRRDFPVVLLPLRDGLDVASSSEEESIIVVVIGGLVFRLVCLLVV